MKNKYFILLVLIALFAACTDKFEEFNTDVKNPAVVAGEPLFSNAQKAMVDQISSTNVNLNDWKLYAQYWTETTYIDEANYDVVNRTVPDYQFRAYYRGFIRDYQEATKIISETAATSEIGEVEISNKLAIIELMVYYFRYLFPRHPFPAFIDHPLAHTGSDVIKLSNSSIPPKPLFTSATGSSWT